MLRLDELRVVFDGRAVVDGWSLAVDDGEIVALLGPSGSGKTTVLRVIAGLVRPDAGTVRLDDVDVTDLPTHRRGVGLVFQDEQLFPHRDVARNVAFGLEMSGTAAAARRARVAELLDLVGLAGFERRDVAELSGGEAKRVALARSLAPAPRVLLLDEPLTGLDRELQLRLADEVAAILRRTGTTAVWVTHDRDEAERVADRVVDLGDGHRPRPEIVTITADDTHDLRRRVLRDGTNSDDVSFPEDTDPTTRHLGVRVGDRLVAVSTWARRTYPPMGDADAVQLRGMAVEPDLRGVGIGGRLLDAGLRRARDDGATHAWARARSSALGFYLDRGWRTDGAPFVDATTGLDHVVVVRDLDDRSVVPSDEPSPDQGGGDG